MRYLITAFIFISLSIGQQPDRQSTQVEVNEFDDNGRVISSTLVNLNEVQQHLIETQQFDIEKTSIEPIEFFGYDTEGRVISSELMEREEVKTFDYEIEFTSDVYDGNNAEYEYEENGRVVN